MNKEVKMTMNTNMIFRLICTGLFILSYIPVSQAEHYGHMMGMDHMHGGMMNEQEPGYGMMHGMRPGYGMHGYGMSGRGIWSLDLDSKQRTELNKIYKEHRKEHWKKMEAMMEERDKLRELYAADKRDPKAIGEVYERINRIQREMIESSIETENRAEAILNKKQREQLRSYRHGMMGPR
jgi:Spy/CpxP family protein refolding chaperone